MVPSRSSPLIAVLLSLLLLGAQQGAFAHMIGHLGGATGHVTLVAQGDDGHGEALSLSHVCTTCVTAAALFAAAPPGVPASPTVAGVADAPGSMVVTAIPAPAPPVYLARAPPAVL